MFSYIFGLVTGIGLGYLHLHLLKQDRNARRRK